MCPTLRTPSSRRGARRGHPLHHRSRSRATADALLLVEAESGKVLHAENATMPWYPASVTKLMTTYVTLQAVKSAAHHARHAAHRLGARRRAGALEDRLQARHADHRRQCDQDPDGEVGERHRRGAGGGRIRFGRKIRRRNEQHQQEPRHDPIELGQSQRPAGGGPDLFGARPRDPRARRTAAIFRNTTCTGTFRRSSSARNRCATTTR